MSLPTDAKSGSRTLPGLLPWHELEHMQYPTYFTAVFSWFETGLGNTNGVLMRYAWDYKQLLEFVREDFGPVFGGAAEVAPGLLILPGFEDLFSAAIVEAIRICNGGAPGRQFKFAYTAKLHKNYA